MVVSWVGALPNRIVTIPLSPSSMVMLCSTLMPSSSATTTSNVALSPS